MMQHEITDEMAKQVWDIWVEKSMDSTMTNLDCVRAALLAVAPRLRAQGMREAAEMLVGWDTASYAREHMLTRATELEKTTP